MRSPHLAPVPLSALVVTAAGGAAGALGRYGVDKALPTPDGGFPWGTFLVNMSEGLLLALLLVLVLEVWPPTRLVRPALRIGLLGGFIPFSSWMVETDQLIARGHVAVAAAYVLASVITALAAVVVGTAAGRLGFARRR